MVTLWSAITSLLLLSLIAWVYALYSRKYIRVLEQKLADSDKALRMELASVNGGAVGVGQRLINLEKKLNEMMARQDKLETGQLDSQPYSQAASLAEDGVDISQLVERCGISEAEARLMTLMQKKSMAN